LKQEAGEQARKEAEQQAVHAEQISDAEARRIAAVEAQLRAAEAEHVAQVRQSAGPSELADGDDAPSAQQTLSHPLMASPSGAAEDADGFCFVPSPSAAPSATAGRSIYSHGGVVEPNVSTDTYGFTLSEELAPHYQRYKKRGLAAYQRRVQVGWEDFVSSRNIDVAISDSTSWYPSFALRPVPPRSAALKALVLRHGIPPEYRGQMWSELVGARAKRSGKPAAYYATLLARATARGAGGAASSISAEEIEKDLDRTFPENAFFNKMGKARLRNVLLAYSERNPKVGRPHSRP
jgi:hypothetical protein